MKSKGQVGTEFLIIVGFVIVVLVPITLMYIQYSSQNSDVVTASKAEHITNEIAAAANSVFAYGEGSQTKLTLDFPSNIKSIVFNGKEVIFTVINSQNQEQEIVQLSDVDLQGEIYIMPGRKDIFVKTVYNYTTQKNVVSVTMPCEEEEELTCYEGTSCTINWYIPPSCVYDCVNSVLEVKFCSNVCTVTEEWGCSIPAIPGICSDPDETCIYVGDYQTDPCLESSSGDICGNQNICCKFPECAENDLQCRTENCVYPLGGDPSYSVPECLYKCVDNVWQIESFCDSCSNGVCQFANPPPDCPLVINWDCYNLLTDPPLQSCVTYLSQPSIVLNPCDPTTLPASNFGLCCDTSIPPPP